MAKMQAKGRDVKLNRGLLAYSATAGAALVASSRAQAAATFTTITDLNLYFNGSLVSGSNVPTKIFGNYVGTASKTFHYGASPVINGFDGARNAFGGVANLKFGLGHQPGTSFIAQTFALGANIAANAVYSTNVSYMLLGHKDVSPVKIRGPFTAGHQSGYIGMHFKAGGEDYYGWLKIKLGFDIGGFPTSISLVANESGIYGAYGDNTILAGQTVVPEPSVVGLTGLGLLACGAAGVRELRRRRLQASAKA